MTEWYRHWFSILKFVVWRWLKMLVLITAFTWCTLKDLMHMDFVSLSGNRERMSGFSTKVTIFGDDDSYSVYADNRKKKISILGKDLTNGLDDTAITAEAKYFINFGEQKTKFCMVLYYSGILIGAWVIFQKIWQSIWLFWGLYCNVLVDQ